MKRMMKRQEAAEEGRPRAQQRPRPAAAQSPGRPQRKPRTAPRTFVREAVAELRRVDWPTRAQVRTYTFVVLIAIVVLGAALALFDSGVSNLVTRIFA
jgi:preprotein translocase subunit SecE